MKKLLLLFAATLFCVGCAAEDTSEDEDDPGQYTQAFASGLCSPEVQGRVAKKYLGPCAAAITSTPLYCHWQFVETSAGVRKEESPECTRAANEIIIECNGIFDTARKLGDLSAKICKPR